MPGREESTGVAIDKPPGRSTCYPFEKPGIMSLIRKPELRGHICYWIALQKKTLGHLDFPLNMIGVWRNTRFGRKSPVEMERADTRMIRQVLQRYILPVIRVYKIAGFHNRTGKERRIPRYLSYGMIKLEVFNQRTEEVLSCRRFSRLFEHAGKPAEFTIDVPVPDPVFEDGCLAITVYAVSDSGDDCTGNQQHVVRMGIPFKRKRSMRLHGIHYENVPGPQKKIATCDLHVPFTRGYHADTVITVYMPWKIIQYPPSRNQPRIPGEGDPVYG